MKKVGSFLNSKYKNKFSNYLVVMTYSIESIAESKRDSINFDELCKLSSDLVILIEERRNYTFLVLVIDETSKDIAVVKEAVGKILDDYCLNQDKYLKYLESLDDTLESFKIKELLGQG